MMSHRHELVGDALLDSVPEVDSNDEVNVDENKTTASAISDDACAEIFGSQAASDITSSRPVHNPQAKQRWKLAGRVIMATAQIMDLVMENRTGAKLLDVQPGGSAERSKIEKDFQALRVSHSCCRELLCLL